MDLTRSPHMTDARSAAVAALGVATPEELRWWCAEQVAAAVNEQNERTRTKPEHAAAWLGWETDDGPERIDPAVDDEWEDEAVYSVHFQVRDIGGRTERATLGLSHHELDNRRRRWDGWQADLFAEWLFTELEITTPVPASTASETESEAAAVSLQRCAPKVAQVAAVLGAQRTPLSGPRAGYQRFVPGSVIEVDLVDAPESDVEGVALFTGDNGDRSRITLTPEGTTLRSRPVHLGAGFHEGRILVSAGGAAITQRLNPILIQEETTP